MELLYFVLTAYGLTQILVFGSIFNKVRPTQGWMGELLSCPMCTGFWVGVLLFGINGYTELFTFDYSLANFLILSWLSSGTTYLLTQFLSDFGFRLEVKKSDD